MMRRQPVRTELHNRDRVDPSEFRPYRELVIAFYQAVLELPHDARSTCSGSFTRPRR